MEPMRHPGKVKRRTSALILAGVLGCTAMFSSAEAFFDTEAEASAEMTETENAEETEISDETAEEEISEEDAEEEESLNSEDSGSGATEDGGDVEAELEEADPEENDSDLEIDDSDEEDSKNSDDVQADSGDGGGDAEGSDGSETEEAGILAEAVEETAAEDLETTISLETYYAVLYEDGSLVFQPEEPDDSDTSVTASFAVDSTTTSTSNRSWGSYASSITSVMFTEGYSYVAPKYLNSWFSDCTSLETFSNAELLDTSNTTSMYQMFYNCSSLETLDVNSWDTSSVTTLQRMFYKCSSLETLDVSGWNTSNVTTLQQTFASCSSLETLDVGGWNTSSVTTMYDTFNGCSKLTELGVGGWDTSNVTSMQAMFYSCSSLEKLDLSEWDTSSVTTLQQTFASCSSLETLDVSGWNTSSVTTLHYTFNGCSGLTELGVGGWDTSNVTNMQGMFRSCSSLEKLDLSEWDTSSVTTLAYTFYGCSQLAEIDVSGWDTSKLTTLAYTFYGCSQLAEIDVSGWDTSKLTTLSNTFYNCSSLEILDVGGWDTSSVTTLAYTFYGCSSLTDLNPEQWDTSAVTVMECAFWDCSSLESLDLSGWDTSHVTTMWAMFYNCSSLSALDVSSWATSSVIDMCSPDYSYNNQYGMFMYCSSLTELDLSGWDVSNVDSFYRMFYECSSLAAIGDTSSWDTSSSQNMAGMFYNCGKLETLDVSGWDISQVTNLGYTNSQTTWDGMFSGCSSLSVLDVSGWDTSSVTNMATMFSGCSSLLKLDVSGWDTSNVTAMFGLFNGCSSITELDLSGWDVSSVRIGYSATGMSYMFNGCASLASVDVSGWDTSNLTGSSMQYMFQNCESLETLDISDWDTTNVTEMRNFLSNCDSLVMLTLGPKTVLGGYWGLSSYSWSQMSTEREETDEDTGEVFTVYDTVTTSEIQALYSSSENAAEAGEDTFVREFELTFYANGGTPTTTLTINGRGVYGEDITVSEPTRTGYIFEGWYTSRNGGEELIEGETVTATDEDGNETTYVVPAGTENPTEEDATDAATISQTLYYAHWTPISYTLVLKSNGSADSDITLEMDYGDFYELADAGFTYDNYVLSGWNTNRNGTGTSFDADESVGNLTTVDGAVVTLYAQWTPISEYASVEYDVYGNYQDIIAEMNEGEYGTPEEIESELLLIGSELGILSDAQCEGLTFVAWHIGSIDGETVQADTVVSGDLTLVAEWAEAVDVIITFMDGLDSDGGSIVSQKRVTSGFTVGDLPEITDLDSLAAIYGDDSISEMSMIGWFTAVQTEEDTDSSHPDGTVQISEDTVVSSSDSESDEEGVYADLNDGNYEIYFYAHWGWKPSFDADGGKITGSLSAYASATYASEWEIDLPEAVRDGYDLVCWALEDGTILYAGVSYLGDGTVTYDGTVYESVSDLENAVSDLTYAAAGTDSVSVDLKYWGVTLKTVWEEQESSEVSLDASGYVVDEDGSFAAYSGEADYDYNTLLKLYADAEISGIYSPSLDGYTFLGWAVEVVSDDGSLTLLTSADSDDGNTVYLTDGSGDSIVYVENGTALSSLAEYFTEYEIYICSYTVTDEEEIESTYSLTLYSADGEIFYDEDGDLVTVEASSSDSDLYTVTAGGSIYSSASLKDSGEKVSRLSLCAVWKEEIYTITFDPGDGSMYGSTTAEGVVTREVEAGYYTGTIPGSLLDGYEFEGWYTDCEEGCTGINADDTAGTLLVSGSGLPEDEYESAGVTQITGDVTYHAHYYSFIESADSAAGTYSFGVKWDNASTSDVDNVDGNLDFHPTMDSEQTASLYIWFELGDDVDAAELEAGAIKIYIPQSVFMDEDGNALDYTNLSWTLPECEYDEDGNPIFEDEDTDSYFSYYEYTDEDGNSWYVLINNKQLDEGFAGFDITVSYSVDPLDVAGGAMDSEGNYIDGYLYYDNDAVTVRVIVDIDSSDGVLDVDDTTVLSLEMHTQVNADAEKTYYGLYESWESSWGDEPEDADDYVYMIWKLTATYTYNSQSVTFYWDESSVHDGTIVKWLTLSSGKLVPSTETVEVYDENGDPVTDEDGNTVTEEVELTGTTSPVHTLSGDAVTTDYVLVKYPASAFTDESLEESQGLMLSNQAVLYSVWDAVDEDGEHYTETMSVSASHSWPYEVEIEEETEDGEGYSDSRSNSFSKDNTSGEVENIFGAQETLVNDEESVSLVWEETYAGKTQSRITNGSWDADSEMYVPAHRTITITDGDVHDDDEASDYYGYTGDLLISDGEDTSKYLWVPDNGNELLYDTDYEITELEILVLEYDYSIEDGKFTTNTEEDLLSTLSDYGDVDVYVRYQGEDDFTFFKTVSLGSVGSDDSYTTVELPSGVAGYQIVYETDQYMTQVSVRGTFEIQPTAHVLSLVGEDLAADITTIIKNISHCTVEETKTDQEGTESAETTYEDNNYEYNTTASEVIYELDKTDTYQYTAKYVSDTGDVIADASDRVEDTYVYISSWNYNTTEGRLTYMKSGVFYDLLPLGTSVDVESVFGMPLTGNYTSSGKGNRCTEYETLYDQWKSGEDGFLDGALYSVTFEEDYGGSGRTMMIITWNAPEDEKITGMQFWYDLQTTYDNISDYGTSQENVVAFVNTSENVAVPEGLSASLSDVEDTAGIVEKAYSTLQSEYTDYISYAQDSVNYKPVSFNTWGFEKAVQAEGEYYDNDSDVTMPGGTYSYKLTYSQSSGDTENIVFIDVLENGTASADTYWQGTFAGVDTSEAEEVQSGSDEDSEAVCSPVVYYSTMDRDSFYVESGSTREFNEDYSSVDAVYTASDGTQKNVWIAADDYEGNLSDVTAVLVDCTKASDGTDFVLSDENEIAVVIKMIAPETAKVTAGSSYYDESMDINAGSDGEFGTSDDYYEADADGDGEMEKIYAGADTEAGTSDDYYYLYGKAAVNESHVYKSSNTSTDSDEEEALTTDLSASAAVYFKEMEGISISKSSDPETGTEGDPAEVYEGSTLYYLLAVTNSGSDILEDIVLTDLVSAYYDVNPDYIEVAIESGTEEDSSSAGEIMESLETVLIGSSARVTLSTEMVTESKETGGMQLTFTVSYLQPGETLYIIIECTPNTTDVVVDNQAQITSVEGGEYILSSETTWHEITSYVLPETGRKTLIVLILAAAGVFGAAMIFRRRGRQKAGGQA